MLEQLYIFYTINDVFVKSYDIARGRLKYEFEENDCHPLLITKRCGRENIWWEDIWHEEMLGKRNPERNGGYFWPDDREIINRVMAHLKEKQRLMDKDDGDADALLFRDGRTTFPLQARHPHRYDRTGV